MLFPGLVVFDGGDGDDSNTQYTVSLSGTVVLCVRSKYIPEKITYDLVRDESQGRRPQRVYQHTKNGQLLSCKRCERFES